MATTENDLDLFGRVKNGVIIEFPVYRLHIKNRSHPIAWYTPAVELPKPELPAFHTYERKVELKNAVIEIAYTTRPYTLQELLGQLRKIPTGDEPGMEPGMVSIADVDPALVQHIYGMASDYLTGKMIEFAATRGYGTQKSDAFTSLMTYADSAIEKFRTEALRAKNLRDQAWANMLTYFGQVTTGAVPVPTTIEEIDALIPPLTWEEAV